MKMIKWNQKIRVITSKT